MSPGPADAWVASLASLSHRTAVCRHAKGPLSLCVSVLSTLMQNDEVYDRIEANESALAQPESLTKGMDADEDRKPRTREEMVAEAGDLRCLFYS